MLNIIEPIHICYPYSTVVTSLSAVSILTFSPHNRGMLRRSRCVLIFLRILAVVR